MKNIFIIFIFWFGLFISETTLAKFSYEGHLADLSDTPIINQAATLKVSIVAPVSACIIFQEEHSIITNDKGFFTIQVGGGTDIDGLSNTLDGVFNNGFVINGLAACTYTPVAGDGRRLQIEVDTGGGYENLGYIALGKAPQAAHADAIGGFDITKLVRVSSGAAPLLSSADATTLSALIAGVSPLYATSAGSVNTVTATTPLVSSGGTNPNITIVKATGSADGYLASMDWTTFNNKLGTSSTFSGDLSGTSLTLSVVKIRGYNVSATPPSTGAVLKYDGSQYVPLVLGLAATKNIGTTTGTVAAGDDPRLVNALSSSLLNGQVFVGDAGNIATQRSLNLSDIKSSINLINPAFNVGSGCSPGQALNYSSITDDFSCAAMGLTAPQITGALGYTPAISSSHLNNSTSNSFDFALANHITSSLDCATMISFANLRDGGTYKILMQAGATTQCNFASSLTGIDAAAVTYKFSPANGLRTSGVDTMYELSRFGNVIYIKWGSFN